MLGHGQNLISRTHGSSTGSASSKYEHRRASALCMGKKPIVSVTYENERILIKKNSLPYLKCVLRLSCVVQGPIYGHFMGFYVNGFLSISEMPTSGDLKSGDSFFCISPPNINDQPPSAPHKHNSIQSLIGSGHYMKSLMSYRPSQLAFMILSVMKYVRK